MYLKSLILFLTFMLAVTGLSIASREASAPTAQGVSTPSIGSAYEALKAAKYEEAVAEATAILAQDAHSIAALTIRSEAQWQLGRKEDAVRDLGDAATLAPQNKELRLGLCSDLYQLHRLDDALAACSAAIEIDPQYVEAFNARALAHDAKDDAASEQLGLQDINRSIVLDSTSGWAFAERCELKIELRQEATAMPDCDRSIELDPSNGWTWYQRGTLDLDAKDYNRAEVDFKGALERHSSVFYTYLALARAQNALSKYDDAIANVNVYIAKFPGVASGYLVRAQSELGLAQKDAALADANKSLALAKSPGDERVVTEAKALIASLQPKP